MLDRVKFLRFAVAQINWTPRRGCSSYSTTHRYTSPLPLPCPALCLPHWHPPSVDQLVRRCSQLANCNRHFHCRIAQLRKLKTVREARSQLPCSFPPFPTLPHPLPAALPWPQLIQAACAALAAEAESVSRALKTPTRSTSDRMCPERSLTDTHAPRGSLLPPPLPLARCPSRTCAKVICCDHLEQSISSAQHSSLAVAQLNFVSSLWGSTWITCGSLLFSLLSSILLFSFFRSPALAWLGLINSAALKYDAHSVSPPPSPARPVPAPATVLLLQLPSPARQAGRQAPDWVVPSALRTQIATRYGKLLLVFKLDLEHSRNELATSDT